MLSLPYKKLIPTFEKLYKDSLETLRDYQIEALEFRLNHLSDNVLIQLPTGTGKSVVIKSELLYNLSKGLKVLVLAPTSELCKNIAGYLPNYSTMAFNGCTPDLNKPILVSTYRSASKYVRTFRPNTLIVDECHHVAPETQLGMILEQHKIAVTGYTATPLRLDGSPLDLFFDKMYHGKSIHYFINNGYLNDYRLYVNNILTDFESSLGDDLGTQSAKLSPKMGDVVKHWKEYGRNEQTIVFCPTIEYSDNLRIAFKNEGIRASVVSSMTSQTDRKRKFELFKSGYTKVLINVAVFTEGIDVPNANCVMLCRFTFSTSLYLQMIGRVLRPSTRPSIILDMVNNSYYHGSPIDPFHWSLDGSKNSKSGKTNSKSSFYSCVECETNLLKLSMIDSFIKVCCLECGCENEIYPEVPKATKKFLSEFDVNELKEISKDSLETRIHRIINKAKKSGFSGKVAYANEIISMGLSEQLSKKLLQQMGFTKSHLEVFF